MIPQKLYHERRELKRLLRIHWKSEEVNSLLEIVRFARAAGYVRFVEERLNFMTSSLRNRLLSWPGLNGEALVTLAAGYGCAEVMRCLGRMKCDVHSPDQSGRSALWYGSDAAEKDVLRVIIDSDPVVCMDMSTLEAILLSRNKLPCCEHRLAGLNLVLRSYLSQIDIEFTHFDRFDQKRVRRLNALIHAW
jgi:hypothetical protein